MKVYVLCGENCKYEGMTKEQILTAITQAVNEGTIGDIDTGFITTVKTINGRPLKFFVGEQSEYEALSEEQKKNLFALITNDTTKEGLLASIAELYESKEAFDTVMRGETDVPNATKINNLEIKRDENGVLKIGDIIIPQKKLISDTMIIVSNNTSVKIYDNSRSLNGKIFEVIIYNKSYKFKVKLDSIPFTTNFITAINPYNADNETKYDICKITFTVALETPSQLYAEYKLYTDRTDSPSATAARINEIWEIIE